jgi:hypothetical protein
MNIHDNYDSDEEFATPIRSHDLIYCINKKGEIQSCGMQVHSELLKKKHEIGKGLEGTYDNEHEFEQKNELSSKLFTQHGVPLGIYVQPNRMSQHEHTYDEEDHEDITDELYNTLMELANETKRKTNRRLTKKMQRGGTDKRKTKKN